jgi:signal transduction histidine kinase/ActR/RegA family two-component response regulator
VREVAQAQEAPDVSGAMLEAMAALTRSNPLETALIDEEMTLVACHRGVGARLHLRSVQAGVSLYDAAPRTERGQALLWSLALCFKQGQSVFEAEWEDDVVRAELRRVRVGERYAALLALESNARRVSQVVTHNLVLQRSNADLRRSHEVLHHTNEQLRRTHQSQSQELANISHDLRTPLVSIRGYADMLVRGDLGPLQDAQRRGLETMHRNLDRLLGMIENLHEHNNLQQGVVKLRGEDLSMTQLVQDVVDMMQARAQESGSQLSFTLDEQTGPLPAHGDRVRLYQALSNLVGNAVKFTPGGEVRVELRLATEAEGHVLQGRLEEARVSTQQVQPLEAQLTRGSWLRLEVTDTGRGIPEEHLERIFNRYYSAHPGENQGSGLGLAITDQIVQLHGGIIEVTSMVGRGTTFVVWLPIGLTRPRVGSGGYSVTAPLRSLVPGGSVLVVDDDPDVREMTELALSQAGIQVELAANEQEMLEALARCSPAVVLLDYTLQGCANGHELLRRLKAEPGTCELPVLMVTGHSDPDLLQACRDAGAEDVLIKPFDIEELGEVVHGYVVRARAEATAARG